METQHSRRNVYVAIVDDDESVCRSMSRLLRAAHFQPIAYGSAEAFLADANHPRFACLVLDIMLTGMSGIELRRRLAGVSDATPVVFVTAHDDPDMRAEALASGCAGFFLKTEPGTDILACIRRATSMDDGGSVGEA